MKNTVYQKSYQAWSGQVAILSQKDKQPQPVICSSVTNKRGLQNLTEMLQDSGNTLVFEQALLIGRLYQTGLGQLIRLYCKLSSKSLNEAWKH